jgi:hypothetical protein
LSTLPLFHSMQKPWFRRKMVTDAPSTLAKVIPIQHILQAFNLTHNFSKQRLAWHTCLCMGHNAQQLSTLVLFSDNPIEMREIQSRARWVSFWIRVAMIERLLQYLIPPVRSVFGRHAIAEYQILCVVSRTCCEATLPELIELFTELV